MKQLSGINNAESVHYWQNTQGKICVSLEKIKRFMTFENPDSAINWLFLNRYKKSARQINIENKRKTEQ